MSFVDLIWIILIMVKKSCFLNLLVDQMNMLHLLMKMSKPTLKKDDTTQRLKKFGTLLPK
ncbi:UNVERIFIED_ORG: hypothetical protein QFZ59_003323 [Bacillus sp. B2I3]|nr:hypothetical protein [Bacillus sp. B2I3]